MYRKFVAFTKEKTTVRNSLKATTISTIAAQLVLAILAVGIPAVAFWQNALIRHEEKIVTQTAEVLSAALGQANCRDRSCVIGRAKTFASGFANICFRVELEHQESLLWNEKECADGLSTQNAPIDKTISSKAEYSGTVWSLLGYSHARVMITKSLKLDGGEPIGTLQLSRDLEDVYSHLRSRVKGLAAYGVAAVTILTALAYFRIRKKLFVPIDKLIETANWYDADDQLLFLPKGGGGELKSLTTSLQGMIGRINRDKIKLQRLVDELQTANAELTRNQQQMVRTEKMAAVGRLAAGLAHEIGNPLGIVQGYVEMLGRSDLTGEERTQFSSRAEDELARISTLIRQLLGYGRQNTAAVRSRIRVEPLLQDILAMTGLRQGAGKNSVMTVESEEGLNVCGDVDRLRQVLLNCILNGLDAMADGPGGNLLAIAARRGGAGNEKVVIEIRDSGPGFSKEGLEHAFDPFYTSKEVGEGTGLGLYVSHIIIEEMQGTMHLRNADQGGAIVEIVLPAAENDSMPCG